MLLGSFLAVQGKGQKHTVDSLRQLVASDAHDSIRAEAAITLAYDHFSNQNPDSGLLLTAHWMEVAKRRKFDRIYWQGFETLLHNYWRKGRFDSCLLLTDQMIASHDFAEVKRRFPKVIVGMWLVRGTAFEKKGNLESGASASLQALQYAQSYRDTSGISAALINLGIVNRKLGNLEAALDYYKRANRIHHLQDLSISDRAYEQAIVLGNIGRVYKQMEQYDSALTAYQVSNQLFCQLENEFDLCIGYLDIGEVYLAMKQTDSAHYYWDQAYHLATELKHVEFQFVAKNLMVKLAIAQEDWRLGRKYLAECEVIILQQPTPTIWMEFYKTKTAFSYALGDYKQAYEDLAQVFIWNDSILNEEKIASIKRWETRYKTQEKERAIATLSATNLEQALALQARDQLISRLVLGGAMLAALVSLGIWALQQRQRLKEQKAVYRAIAETELAEQRRIARELHDGMGALLATIARKVAPSAPPAQNDEETYHLVRKAAEEMRRISHNLMPTDLLKFGLEDAVQNLVDHVNALGLKTTFVSHGDLQDLPLWVQLQTYRILQELVHNTAKHAEASYLQVQLTRHATHLNILIEDDGKGFNPAQIPEGLGLQSLRTRTELLTGTFHIDSHPSAGTSISLDIPIGAPDK